MSRCRVMPVRHPYPGRPWALEHVSGPQTGRIYRAGVPMSDLPPRFDSAEEAIATARRLGVLASEVSQ